MRWWTQPPTYCLANRRDFSVTPQNIVHNQDSFCIWIVIVTQRDAPTDCTPMGPQLRKLSLDCIACGPQRVNIALRECIYAAKEIFLGQAYYVIAGSVDVGVAHGPAVEAVFGLAGFGSVGYAGDCG